MRLYCSKGSPLAGRVIILLNELELSAELSFVNPRENPPELIAANPLCKIPCLISGEGVTLYDSDVICLWLDATFGEGRYHHPHGDFWQFQRSLALAIGICDASVALINEKWREALESPFWRRRFINAIVRGLQVFEDDPRATESIDMVTITLVSALLHIDRRHGEIAWRERFPRLAGWDREARTWPSIQLLQRQRA